MKTYEVTLAGYDGSTSDTDHLVFWINAPDLEALNRFLERYQHPKLYENPRVIDLKPHEHGSLDFTLSPDGGVIEGHAVRAFEFMRCMTPTDPAPDTTEEYDISPLLDHLHSSGESSAVALCDHLEIVHSNGGDQATREAMISECYSIIAWAQSALRHIGGSIS